MDWEKTIEPAWLARAMRVCTTLAIPVGVFAIILRTHEPIAALHGWLIVDLIWIVTAYLALDLVLRFGFAVSEILRYPDDFRHLLHIYLADFNTITDIVAAFAVPLPAMFGASVETAELFGLLWLLKLARHAHGLSLLGRVIRSSAQALLSVLLSFSLVLIAASTVAYLAERETQPEQFGSIPLAMWWAIVTLTTTGYGDVTPATLAGRVLAGAVMMCGIGVFALWAGIIASGFSDVYAPEQ